ncbi:hypothetical protein ACQJBY_067083 [Aegilops geniculata]
MRHIIINCFQRIHLQIKVPAPNQRSQQQHPPPSLERSMNSQSIMAVPSVFAAFDKDGDGKVSVSELRRCMEATLGEDVPEEEAAVILAAVDADGDGLLNQEEFSRLAAAGTHEEDDADIKRRCLWEAFGMYASAAAEEMTATTTTMITPASLRRTLSRLGSHELGVEECRAMICRFDLDGDGKLSFDEFRVMMMA